MGRNRKKAARNLKYQIENAEDIKARKIIEKSLGKKVYVPTFSESMIFLVDIFNETTHSTTDVMCWCKMHSLDNDTCLQMIKGFNAFKREFMKEE